MKNWINTNSQSTSNVLPQFQNPIKYSRNKPPYNRIKPSGSPLPESRTGGLIFEAIMCSIDNDSDDDQKETILIDQNSNNVESVLQNV